MVALSCDIYQITNFYYYLTFVVVFEHGLVVSEIMLKVKFKINPDLFED